MGKDQELLQAVKTEDLLTVQKLLQRPRPGKASKTLCCSGAFSLAFFLFFLFSGLTVVSPFLIAELELLQRHLCNFSHRLFAAARPEC